MDGLLAVMIGGALGAGARYSVGVAVLSRPGSSLPWATLAVNLVGGLAMGLLIGILARAGGNETARLFFGVGILGGFTTFSAFGLEVWLMIERGNMALALGYALASVIGAVLATGAGLAVVRAVA